MGTISFSLKKTITCDAICINEASISDQRNAKLLGVVFDSHLKFSSHVDAAIVTCLPLHCSPQQSWRVNESSLAMFYQSQVNQYYATRLPAGTHSSRGVVKRNSNNFNKYA